MGVDVCVCIQVGVVQTCIFGNVRELTCILIVYILMYPPLFCGRQIVTGLKMFPTLSCDWL